MKTELELFEMIAADLIPEKQKKVGEGIEMLIEDPSNTKALDSIIINIGANLLCREDEKRIRENILTLCTMAAKEMLEEMSDKDKINKMYGSKKPILEGDAGINAFQKALEKKLKVEIAQFKFDRGYMSEPTVESTEKVSAKNFKWKKDPSLSPLSGKLYGGKK